MLCNIWVCDYFKHLNQAENAKHKSQRIISEFLQVIATQIEEKQLQNALLFFFCSLLIDETTDVSAINEMVIYARYMYDGNVATMFLKICELFDGTADTIETSLQDFMTDKGLPVSRMVGLGTDGANVMVGRHSGVAARFKQHQPLPAFTVSVIAWLLQLHRLGIMLHTFVTNSNQPFHNCFTFITTAR